MPVMVLDVPESAWNEVVLQAILFGLDISPDNHQDRNSTIVEITGTWDKLNSALTRMKRRGPEFPQLLEVMESKEMEPDFPYQQRIEIVDNTEIMEVMESPPIER